MSLKISLLEMVETELYLIIIMTTNDLGLIQLNLNSFFTIENYTAIVPQQWRYLTATFYAFYNTVNWHTITAVQ